MGHINDPVLIMLAVGVSSLGVGAAVWLGSLGWLNVKKFEREAQAGPALPRRQPDEMLARIDRIEQIVEATAIEVERITESQRYLTRTLGERAALPPVDLPAPRRNDTPH